MAGASKLHGFRVEAAGEAVEPLPFLAGRTVDVELRGALTFLVGENGSGKTTLLEAIAARCGIRPGGGDSYAETEEREGTAASGAVSVRAGRRMKGVFLRADRFEATMARAGRLPMVQTGEWRLAEEQSRARACCRCWQRGWKRARASFTCWTSPRRGCRHSGRWRFSACWTGWCKMAGHRLWWRRIRRY